MNTDKNENHKIFYWFALILLFPFLVWQKFFDTYKIESFCASGLIMGVVTYWAIGYLTWRGIT